MEKFAVGLLGEEDKIQRVNYLLATIVIGAIILTLIDNDPDRKVITNVIKQYGDFFAAIGLLLAVWGLYFSVITMKDLRRVINNFDEFASRFRIMIEEVISDSDTTKYLRIMAYTPLPGRLALSEGTYRSLHDALVDQRLRVEVTCLDSASLVSWNQKFEGKKTEDGTEIKPSTIEETVNEIEGFIHDLTNPHQGEGKEWRLKHPIVRGPTARMPKFFAYFTDSRALIINMLFYPSDELPKEQQSDFFVQNPTEVIGFETMDTYTIKKIKEVYRLVRLQINTPPKPETLAPKLGIVGRGSA
jgi:hypothetical protein